MTDTLSTALTLLGVGMITVFTILVMIVLIGNILIRLINKYMPEMPVEKTGLKDSDNGVLAAIFTTVEIITGGEGRVESAEKRK